LVNRYCAVFMSNYIESEECLWVAEILHFEVSVKKVEDCVQAKNEDIINVDSKNYPTGRRIINTYLRCLFESVERFVES